MDVIKNISKLELFDYIYDNNHLFHLTNEAGLKGILTTHKVKSLTNTGEAYVTSFTEHPLGLLGEYSFEDKNYILVFNKGALVEQGVREVEYVLKGYKTFSEKEWWKENSDFELEYEWRYNKEIDIYKGNALIGVINLEGEKGVCGEFCKYGEDNKLEWRFE